VHHEGITLETSTVAQTRDSWLFHVFVPLPEPTFGAIISWAINMGQEVFAAMGAIAKVEMYIKVLNYFSLKQHAHPACSCAYTPNVLTNVNAIRTKVIWGVLTKNGVGQLNKLRTRVCERTTLHQVVWGVLTKI